ncbi:hypothetical protein SAMN05444000_13911 [Shimia gijangensis]|uniref:Uncharacterized protein n=1 Tax=Shimia gijangensis TaxID=1470563 RepID=A0A1M6TG04_9RHOB|nr:hypothetical protein [Shimia gijangensis]SHK55917.1 hypothetical protein SAMN05444000_13911 [Shimia gijangensis]
MPERSAIAADLGYAQLRGMDFRRSVFLGNGRGREDHKTIHSFLRAVRKFNWDTVT